MPAAVGVALLLQVVELLVGEAGLVELEIRVLKSRNETNGVLEAGQACFSSLQLRIQRRGQGCLWEVLEVEVQGRHDHSKLECLNDLFENHPWPPLHGRLVPNHQEQAGSRNRVPKQTWVQAYGLNSPSLGLEVGTDVTHTILCDVFNNHNIPFILIPIVIVCPMRSVGSVHFARSLPHSAEGGARRSRNVDSHSLDGQRIAMQ